MFRTVCALLLLNVTLSTFAQESPDSLHPIAAQAAAAVADDDAPFVMIVRFKTLADKADDLVAAMAAPRKETVKEAGNLAYELSQSSNNKREFVLYEKWKSVAALDSHLKQPYLVKLGEALGVVLSEPPTIEFYVPVE